MKPIEPEALLASWPEREKQWRIALGRIRIGVEPIEEQLERLRGVTVAGSMVAGGIGLILAALFAAKGAALIGLIVAVAMVGPIIATSWLGFRKTKARAARYLAEREVVERLRALSSEGDPSAGVDGV